MKMKFKSHKKTQFFIKHVQTPIYSPDLTPKLAKDFSDGMARSDAINTKISARATEHSNLETSLQSISTNIDQVSSSVTQSYVTQSQLAANSTSSFTASKGLPGTSSETSTWS